MTNCECLRKAIGFSNIKVTMVGKGFGASYGSWRFELASLDSNGLRCMSDETYSLYRIVQTDSRYALDAYLFVRESLAYAADCMELDFYEDLSHPGQSRGERHLTGQQLCEAIRQYATNQFGYMAKIVLKSWGIESTSCFGDIVYNMIRAGIMKKSEHDLRSHFDDVYQFDEVFQNHFEFGESLAHRRA